MARPTSHAEVPEHDRTVAVATFELTEITDNPAAMEAYAAFLRAVKKEGKVTADSKYGGSVTVKRTRSAVELDEALAARQKTWDTTDKRYTEVQAAYEAGDLSTLDSRWYDYEATTLRVHAENEGYSVFLLISKDADDRQAARTAVGFEG